MNRRPMNGVAEPPRKTLAAESVTYHYPTGAEVLGRVSLLAESGRITMLVGRSGSGKTTLLRVLQGLLRPAGGRVVRDPRDLVCTYIPQGLGLVRNATALQNVLNGTLAGVGWLASVTGRFRAAAVSEAEWMLERVGLARKAGVLTGRLSGGERQRVAIARSLMRRPDFVLADEFVSQLDAVTASEIEDLVRQTAAAGTGWVITTHHLNSACGLGHRVVALKDGRVALDRPAEDTSPVVLEEAIR